MPRGHLGCGGRCASPPPGSGTHPPTDCTQAHPRRLVALAPAPQGLPSRQGSPQAPPPLVAPRQAPCWLEVRGPPCSCHTPRVHPGPPPPPGAARPASPGSSRLWASAPLLVLVACRHHRNPCSGSHRHNESLPALGDAGQASGPLRWHWVGGAGPGATEFLGRSWGRTPRSAEGTSPVRLWREKATLGLDF